MPYHSPEYQLIATDLQTGLVREEIPFSTFNITEKKNAPNTGSFTLPMLTSQEHNLVTEAVVGPGHTAMVVLRGGLPIGRYAIWDDGGNHAGRTITLRGMGVASYLAMRRMRSDLIVTDRDQFLIVEDLINQAQATTQGDIGLLVNNGGLSGVLRSRHYLATERLTYLAALNEMANSTSGFEWYETTEDSPLEAESKYFSTLQLRPTLTALTSIVLDLQKNVENLTFTGTARKMANIFDSFSKPKEGTVPEFRTGSNTASLNVFPQFDGFEQVGVPAEATSGELLQGRSDQYVKNYGFPLRSFSLDVREDVDAQFTDYQLGNICRLTAKEGYLQENGSLVLLNGRSLEVSSTGKEKISLQASRVLGT